MKTRIFLITGLFILSFVSCKNDKTTSDTGAEKVTETEEHQGQAAVEDSESDANALQVARSLEDFSTLVAAIEAAG